MSPLVTLETLQSMVWPDVKLKKNLHYLPVKINEISNFDPTLCNIGLITGHESYVFTPKQLFQAHLRGLWGPSDGMNGHQLQ